MKSFNKKWGYFTHGYFTHNNLETGSDHDGYFTLDVGAWYNTSNTFRLFDYKVPIGLTIQPVLGEEWRTKKRDKYGISLTPKIGNDISFPISYTMYNSHGSGIETEKILSFGILITK